MKAMSLILALAAVCFGFTMGEQYEFNEFEAWNAFKEGSSVEFEQKLWGGTDRVTKTIVKKEKKVVTVRKEYGSEDARLSEDEKVTKWEGPTIMEGNCPLCKKPYKDHKKAGTWSKENVTVGGKELECDKWVSPATLCNGSPVDKTTMWYCKDVPGHMVKYEGKDLSITLVKFEVKK